MIRLEKHQENNGNEKSRFQGAIRPISHADLGQITLILSEWITRTDDTGTPEEKIRRYQGEMTDTIRGDSDNVYFAAEENGTIIGIIGGKTPNPRLKPFIQTDAPLELVNMYVKSSERKGRGVGRALVTHLETYARAKKHSEIILVSGPSWEETGWSFYDRLPDYHRRGVAQAYYGINEADESIDAPVWSKVLLDSKEQ